MIQGMDISFSAEMVCLANQGENGERVGIMAGSHDPCIRIKIRKNTILLTMQTNDAAPDIAQIPTPASNNPKTTKNPLQKYPIAKINRHMKTTI
jgi:hypothetical protein